MDILGDNNAGCLSASSTSAERFPNVLAGDLRRKAGPDLLLDTCSGQSAETMADRFIAEILARRHHDKGFKYQDPYAELIAELLTPLLPGMLRNDPLALADAKQIADDPIMWKVRHAPREMTGYDRGHDRGTPTVAERIDAKGALKRVNIRLGNLRPNQTVNGRGSGAISRLEPGTGGAAGKPGRGGKRPPVRKAIERAVGRWFTPIGEITPESFASVLPVKPYCTDFYEHGVTIRSINKAITFRHIQPNHPNYLIWLLLDIDRSDAATAWMDENLPQPTIIVINPENGHGHYYYLLRTPVQKFETSSQKALAFFAAVERGFTRRLKADIGYSGLMAKNPLHSDWRVLWGPSKSYTLPDLDQWLEDEDKAPIKRVEFEFGIGRNCSIFDSVRKFAYSRVMTIKKNGGSIVEFREDVESACQQNNQRFDTPLGAKEVGLIAKSIANWTWRKFSIAAQARIQAARARRRWDGHTKRQPWLEYGLSERTYWRRKKAGTLPEPNPSNGVNSAYMASLPTGAPADRTPAGTVEYLTTVRLAG